MEVLEIAVPAHLRYVAVVRMLVVAASAPAELSKRRLEDLKLVVSEAVTNAVEAHQAEPDEPIRVRCWVDGGAGGTVHVEVRDRGAGFDPSSIEGPPPAEHPDRVAHERGLGIPLIRMFANEVSFERTTDGTVVHMVIEPAAPHDDDAEDGAKALG